VGKGGVGDTITLTYMNDMIRKSRTGADSISSVVDFLFVIERRKRGNAP
jgi:hypothetical protein